jgi:Flp pilus assembly pilin Flp
MLASSPFPNPDPRSNVILNIFTRARLAVRRFNDDEQGMNTVEAIILLFVAAVVLLVFFALIWPLIRESVMEQLNSLFGQTGQP